MTLDDVKKITVLQTRTIAAACKDPDTHNYVVECLKRFYSGDYGEICSQDTAYNNQDLESGAGHILARYKPAHRLDGDIYIECHFDENESGVDWNNTMIMYCSER